MFAGAVVLSVLGLLMGATLASWSRGSRQALAALDGANLAIVPALILLRLLPHSVEETGAWAVGACGLGYLVFAVVETKAHGRATDIGMAIVLPALALHGFLDGTGLALAFQEGSSLGGGATAVGVALVLHKIPEGLFVASILVPSLGARPTWIRLAALAAATVFGALTGRELIAHTSDAALHLAVAAGLGVMLRMAIHRHGLPPGTKPERLASGRELRLLPCGLVYGPGSATPLGSSPTGRAHGVAGPGTAVLGDCALAARELAYRRVALARSPARRWTWHC